MILHALVFHFVVAALQERVHRPVRGAVEYHLGGLADGVDLFGLTDDAQRRPIDDDGRAGQLLHELPRPAVLADEPALVAPHILAVPGGCLQVDNVEHHHVVGQQFEGVLGGEPAADGLDDVRALQARDGVADRLDPDRPGFAVDVQPHFGARLYLTHRLPTLADEHADAVLRNLHVLHNIPRSTALYGFNSSHDHDRVRLEPLPPGLVRSARDGGNRVS